MLPIDRKLRNVIFNPEDAPAAAEPQQDAPPAKKAAPPKKTGEDDDVQESPKGLLFMPAPKALPPKKGPVLLPNAYGGKKAVDLAKQAQFDKAQAEGDIDALISSLFPGKPAGAALELLSVDDVMSLPGGETVNQLAAEAMADTVHSLEGSPWIYYDTSGLVDKLSQLMWSLQNPELQLVGGPGFIIALSKEGRRLTFTRASPRTTFKLQDRFPATTLAYQGKPVVDLTYWNVSRSWGGDVRAVTVPVCRVSGLRGVPILGTGVNSVRRALATMGPHCPCQRPFHVSARGDDGRTLEGHDLVKLKEWGWKEGDPLPAPHKGGGPPPGFQPSEPVDPFPDGV